MANTIFEQTGGTYTQVGDYMLPDLLPAEEMFSRLVKQLSLIHIFADWDTIKTNWFAKEAIRYILSLSPDAVSYTHLDVYKRQGLPCR